MASKNRLRALALALAVAFFSGASAAATIGDLVWKDVNENMAYEIGEPGIAGVQLELIYTDGTLLSSTVTDANGAYSFDVSFGGTEELSVRVDTSNLPFTTPTYDFDGIDTPHWASFTFSPGSDYPDIDFGYIPEPATALLLATGFHEKASRVNP